MQYSGEDCKVDSYSYMLKACLGVTLGVVNATSEHDETFFGYTPEGKKQMSCRFRNERQSTVWGKKKTQTQKSISVPLIEVYLLRIRDAKIPDL